METQINLSKRNKRLLKKVINYLFPEVRKINYFGNTAKLRKGVFAKSIRINVIDFVLLEIPQKLNEISEELGYGKIYPYFNSLSESLDYFSEVDDVIEEIHSNYIDFILSNQLNDNYSETVIVDDKIEIIENHKTKKHYKATVENYRKGIDEVIETSEHELKVVHISTNSASRAPPLNKDFILLDTG